MKEGDVVMVPVTVTSVGQYWASVTLPEWLWVDHDEGTIEISLEEYVAPPSSPCPPPTSP